MTGSIRDTSRFVHHHCPTSRITLACAKSIHPEAVVLSLINKYFGRFGYALAALSIFGLLVGAFA